MGDSIKNFLQSQVLAANVSEDGQQEKMKALQEDPAFKPMFDDIKQNGPDVVMKYLGDEALMRKLSQKLGGITPEIIAAHGDQRGQRIRPRCGAPRRLAEASGFPSGWEGCERERLQGRHAAWLRCRPRPAVHRQGAHRREGEHQRRGQRRQQRRPLRRGLRQSEDPRAPPRPRRGGLEGEPDGSDASCRRAAEQAAAGCCNPPASWCEVSSSSEIHTLQPVLIFIFSWFSNIESRGTAYPDRWTWTCFPFLNCIDFYVRNHL